MTLEERMALPGWREYERATSVPRKVIYAGIKPDDIYAFVAPDGTVYHPTLHDGVWYKL